MPRNGTIDKSSVWSKPAKPEYRYEVSYAGKNGFMNQTDWNEPFMRLFYNFQLILSVIDPSAVSLILKS